MAPKKASPSKPTTAEAPAQPSEDQLLARLAEKEVEAATWRERLLKLEAAKETLSAQNLSLLAEADRSRATLRDINDHLTAETRVKASRVAELETQLAAMRAELDAAAKRQQEEIDWAVQRYRSDLAQKVAELAAAQERLRAFETFMVERDSLQAQLRALGEEIDELKKVHHKKIMDLERKHAQDRELWKKDSAAAVKAAREEMMALTDNRLEITTKRTILENEQMSGELQYQSRQVQKLVQRNEALQRELSEMRVSLDIAKRGEEELVKKNSLCEKTIETLLARLEQQDAERVDDDAVSAEYAERVAGLEEEVHMAVMQLDERADQVARLGRELEAARKDLETARINRTSVAKHLEQCLGSVRQQLAGTAAWETGSGGAPEQGADIPRLEEQERVLLHLLRNMQLEW